MVVTKRLLIRGAGAPGDTRLDQRANSPALRLERVCVVENLDVDMTGFREALHVAVAAPLIQRCILRRGADHSTAASGCLVQRCIRSTRSEHAVHFHKLLQLGGGPPSCTLPVWHARSPHCNHDVTLGYDCSFFIGVLHL